MWARDQLRQQDYRSFIRDARDYALLHGLVLRNAETSNYNVVSHIPFTLFPSPIPRQLYQECIDIQPTVSTLMLKIANDAEFIDESLSPIAQVDDFTRNLLKVNKIVQKEGLAQPIISCINRADYLLDKFCDDNKDELRIRQVEVNAIASAMSSHSFNVRLLHNYLMSKYGIGKPDNWTVPENGSLKLVADGIVEAFNLYNQTGSYILLVGEEYSTNFSDHLLIEMAVHKIRPDIRFVRRDFTSLPDITKLGPNKELIVEESKEIALVYFRYGYDPSHYYFEGAWDIRLLLERSRAIKCPSINFHLAGAKKFQQVINNQKQLEKYLDAKDARRMEQIFCKIWPIDSGSTEGEEGFKVGMDLSRSLVLKPQREGGGHNVFGNEVRTVLERIVDSEERSQYILMEHIDSPREENWLLLPKDDNDATRLDKADQLVTELGIFGSIFADGSNIINNNVAGYLGRSKRFGVNEGGVSAGFAGISNVFLIDDLQGCDWKKVFRY